MPVVAIRNNRKDAVNTSDEEGLQELTVSLKEILSAVSAPKSADSFAELNLGTFLIFRT